MHVERYFLILIFLQILDSIVADALLNASTIDLTKCKISQLGTEYRGFVLTSAGGYRCQSWTAEKPLHKISADIKDTGFPERSMKLAKNYCRNPTRDPRGPWCYTLEPTVSDDDCDIPLCDSGDCTITGPGAEYGGNRSFSFSKRKCKSWNRRHKLGTAKTIKFDDKYFPEGSRESARNFCRNPNDDAGGPWCYVEEKDYEGVEKEYCDIPFCDVKDCLMYTRNASTYSMLTGLNSSYGNISFWIKLWNPLDEQTAEARIILTLLPVPSSAEKIAQDWKAGIELLISNNVTGQTYPNFNDNDMFESTPNMLISSKWTGLWITWGGGFISLGLHGFYKPLITGEYKTKDSISSLYPYSFLYYGVKGTGVLWSTDFCQNYCESHTTFGVEFLNIWPMHKTNDTWDFHFFVRAKRNLVIRLHQSPGTLFPCFIMEIGRDDVAYLLFQEREESMKQHLQEITVKGLLDYWIWKEFSISIFGTQLRLFVYRAFETEDILRVTHDLLNTLRWFSIGSDQTIAHWTFFCLPDATDAVEDPHPPNCIHSLTDYQYQGNQWIGEQGFPCVPWIAKNVPPKEQIADNFIDKSVIKVLNRCRNPSHDPNGPYCYAITSPHATNVTKRYCPIRICRSLECRMAGTANDYIGTLSTTRTGRTCAKWLSDYDLQQMMQKLNESMEELPFKIPKIEEQDIPVKPSSNQSSPSEPIVKPVHMINRAYLNDSLYPERSVYNASNYCRDPSRNIAGTWCYTTDPLVPYDLCDIRDCEKPEECIFFVRGHSIGRRLYVLPEHRTEGLVFSLKAWEPDQPDSITFVFTADDGFKSRYILKIGALDNEKVLLYYESEEEDIILVKKKTLPHLLYLGKWTSFVIRVPRGRVLLYYEGAVNPLFEWEHPDATKAFLPIFYYYSSEKGHAIGVAFDCATRCHIENTHIDRYTRILPISTWFKEKVVSPERLMLMVRANGVVLVALWLLPATPGYYIVMLGEKGEWINFLKNIYPKLTIYHKQKSPKPIFTTNSWTNITIQWSGHEIDVFSNETIVFHYVHRHPLIFYFFSLAVDSGNWATWTANCIPSDIDGPPVDGGWSEWGPWACSASCNGGIGTRKRSCTSPEPNVRGEPCLGPNTMTGRCNTIVCGDLTDDTVNLIKRAIAQNYTAVTVKERESISLVPDYNTVNVIRTESPKSPMEWSHNGLFLQSEENRLEIKDYTIVITRAVLNDSGVYTLTVHRPDGTYMIFKMITLAVIPIAESVTIRETRSMHITCHCAVIGYVYSDLKIYWTIDDKVWSDYGVTVPLAVNVEYIRIVNRSHHGTWKCVTEQNDLNFKWITNVIRVKVLGPPNWRTYLMEDKLTRPIFGWMPNETFVAYSALFIILFLIACILIASIYFIRFRESLRINIIRRERMKEKDKVTEEKEKATEENIALVKTNDETATSNPVNSKNLHRTGYNVQQSRMKNLKLHANVNQSNPYQPRPTKEIINRWSRKLNKTGLTRKNWNNKFLPTHDETLDEKMNLIDENDPDK